MLRSYEAIYDHGQLRWVNDAPKETPLRVIVTVIAEVKTATAEPKAVELSPSPNGGKSVAKEVLGWERSTGGEATDFTRPHPNPPPLGEGTVKINPTALTSEPARKRRRPPPELAGMMRVVNVEDNLVEPGIPETEWDVLK